jgi:hypothetical protein
VGVDTLVASAGPPGDERVEFGRAQVGQIVGDHLLVADADFQTDLLGSRVDVANPAD